MPFAQSSISIYIKKCATPIFTVGRVCFTAILPLNFDDLDDCIDGRKQQGFAMPAGVTWHSMGRHIMCHDSISGQDPVPVRSGGSLAGLLYPDAMV